MPMPVSTEESVVCRLPVLVQNLPDLRYKDDDWMSQKQRQIAIGSVPVSVLVNRFKVDWRTDENPEGYQRLPTENRVVSLKNDLAFRRVDLPTAILLNLREFDQNVHLDIRPDGTDLLLQPHNHLFLVDGQHRVESLVRLYKEDPEKWGDSAIPFVCLLGADRDGEMAEFLVVNSNAKSIDTGLAYELLKHRADNSAAVRERLTETGRAWVQTAETLTRKLSGTPIWSGRIRFPGQKQQGTLITNNGMATSLRPLVEQPGFFQSIGDTDQQVRVLYAFWEGIELVVPEVMADPEKFNIQRTLGVAALHAVLVNVLAIMSSKGFSVLDPAKFREVIEPPLKELSGLNADGELVHGTDFWKRGAEGASALFNSRAGRRILHAQITDKLPPISVE